MLRWFYGIAVSILAAASVAGAFTWYGDRPSSYDECVVHEMRGQSAPTMYTVSKVCAIKFHKEEELSLSALKSGSLDFVLLPNFKLDPDASIVGSRKFEKAPMQVTVLKNETEYDVTRLRMKYAYKFVMHCSTLSDDDWNEEQDAVFSKGVADVDVPTKWDENYKLHVTPKCIHFLKIWGALRQQG